MGPPFRKTNLLNHYLLRKNKMPIKQKVLWSDFILSEKEYGLIFGSNQSRQIFLKNHFLKFVYCFILLFYNNWLHAKCSHVQIGMRRCFNKLFLLAIIDFPPKTIYHFYSFFVFLQCKKRLIITMAAVMINFIWNGLNSV